MRSPEQPHHFQMTNAIHSGSLIAIQESIEALKSLNQKQRIETEMGEIRPLSVVKKL